MPDKPRFLVPKARRGDDFDVVEAGHTSPCWQWLKSTDQDGYGRLKIAGKMHRAHRVYYEAERGPIPDGLQIDHLCRNTGCVNPDHLEPVTLIENVRRSRVRKLTPDQIEEIRTCGGIAREVAERFGIHRVYVAKIRAGMVRSNG